VSGIGAMNENFEIACLEALKLRDNGCAQICRRHVLEHYNGSERTARILEENLIDVNAPRRGKLVRSSAPRLNLN
jgi:hypothetical protein